MALDHSVARLGVSSSPESKARVCFNAFFLFLLFSTAVERTKLKPGFLIKKERDGY